MADWKNNKMVGIAAVVVFILCAIFVVFKLTAKVPPAAPETPFKEMGVPDRP